MKILKELASALTIVLMATAFVACSDDDPTPEQEQEQKPGEQVDPDAPVKGTMTAASLTGYVTDTDGKALTDVTVVSGTHSATTNEAGAFTFSQLDVNEGRSIVVFKKDGYFTVTRSADYAAENTWNIVLAKKGAGSFTAAKSFSSSETARLMADGMKVSLLSNGFKKSSTGEAYSGTVKAEMLYLDPNNANFADMMPGSDLSGVRTDGTRASLVSYGMTAVNLTDNDGNPLQITDSTPATVTFPIPEGMERNAPASIPLWSFDEDTGRWVEEGEATLQDGVYVGTVTHFSWWNLDYPEEEATVTGTIKDEEGNILANQRVRVGQVTARTNAEGRYTQNVPAGTAFDVTVCSVYYGNYTPEVSVSVPALSPKQTYTADLTLPHIYKVTGRVLSSGNPAVAYLWLSYNGTDGEKTITDGNGRFSLSIPTNYVGAAKLNVLCNGKTSLDLTLGKDDVDMGDIELGGQDPTPDGGAMTPTEAKLYMEQVAIDFLNKFNPDEQADVISLANYFVNTYGDLEEPEEWGLDEYDEGYYYSARKVMRGLQSALSHRNIYAMSRAFDGVYDFERFAGVWVPGTGRWVKESDSKDIVFKFKGVNGETCLATATGTGSESSMTVDGYTGRVPENVNVTITEGGKTHAKATVKSTVDESGHYANATIDVQAANITTYIELSANDNRITQNTTISVSGANVITTKAVVDGKDLCNRSKIESLIENEDGDGIADLFTRATVDIDVINRLQVGIEATQFRQIANIIGSDYDSYEYDDRDAAYNDCRNDANTLNSNMLTALYYNSSVKQAGILFQPKLEDYGADYGYEDWEWYFEPVMHFEADNTTYGFEEYFGNSRFVSVETLWDSLFNNYKRLWK